MGSQRCSSPPDVAVPAIAGTATQPGLRGGGAGDRGRNGVGGTGGAAEESEGGGCPGREGAVVAGVHDADGAAGLGGGATPGLGDGLPGGVGPADLPAGGRRRAVVLD